MIRGTGHQPVSSPVLAGSLSQTALAAQGQRPLDYGFPSLAQPLPSGADSQTFTPDEYRRRWEAYYGRTMDVIEAGELEAGCIGMVRLHLAHYRAVPSMKYTYRKLRHAKAKQRELNQLIAATQEPVRASIFAIRFDAGSHSADMAAYKPGKDNRVDMDDFRNHDIDPAADGCVRFDYAFWDEETDSWWHANHAEPGMEIYQSTLDHYSRALDCFNMQVFCVAITAGATPTLDKIDNENKYHY